MAGGKVKKGFGTYLLILFLMVVATFFIIVTVMLFSPSKVILGYKYFKGDLDKCYFDEVNTATSDNVDSTDSQYIIDWSEITAINVNCSYGEVKVLRSDIYDYDGVRIINKTAGFAKSNQDTDFDFNIYFSNDNKTLNIEVSEPEGFLYLDKSVEIQILSPCGSDTSFENVALNVVTTSGDIMIGNNDKLSKGNSTIKLKSIALKTGSGSVDFCGYLDSSVSDLTIKTTSGSVNAKNDITASTCAIYLNKGKTQFQDITATSSLTLNVGDSKFYADVITGDVNLLLDDGYFIVDKVVGGLSSNDSTFQMGSGNIKITEVDGNVSLPFAGKTKVTIEKMGANDKVYINGTSGDVNISELHGYAYVELTSGNVTINTDADDISVKTTTGKINVTYSNTSISNGLNFESTKGEISLVVSGSLKFVLDVKNTSGEERESKNINIEFFKEEFENPLKINDPTDETTERIDIVSDAKINLSLIA